MDYHISAKLNAMRAIYQTYEGMNTEVRPVKAKAFVPIDATPLE